MHSVKEKVSNAASAAKEHVDIYKAKVEEKAEKATARTKEEERIAHERRKAKEAEAKMRLHESKAEHAAETQNAKHSRHLCGLCGDDASVVGDHMHHHQPTGTTYPPGVHPPGHKYL